MDPSCCCSEGIVPQPPVDRAWSDPSLFPTTTRPLGLSHFLCCPQAPGSLPALLGGFTPELLSVSGPDTTSSGLATNCADLHPVSTVLVFLLHRKRRWWAPLAQWQNTIDCHFPHSEPQGKQKQSLECTCSQFSASCTMVSYLPGHGSLILPLLAGCRLQYVNFQIYDPISQPFP